jgi:serine/threonine-protein kinase
MDYVAGESLANLTHEAQRRGIRIPPRVTLSVVTGLLYGLQAAHEATNESGEPLSIVHRDVSPQNVLVGVDGVARVLDFGVAKATWRNQTTREGQLKGKLSYMAPEQVKQGAIDRRTDVYSAAVVLWETLTGRRLFSGDNPAAIVNDIMGASVGAPSAVVPDIPAGLDAVVLRGLERDPSRRFQTAIQMARALEDVGAGATPAQVAECVHLIASAQLEQRAGRIAEIENGPEGGTVNRLSSAVATSAAPPEGRRGRAALPTLIITKNEEGEPELTGGGGEAPSLESAYASDPLSQTARPHGSRRWVALTVAMAAVLAVGVATLGLMRPGGTPTVAAAPPAAEPPVTIESPPLPSPVPSALSVAVPTPEPGPPAETRPRRRLGPPRPSGRYGAPRPVASVSPLGRILDVRE